MTRFGGAAAISAAILAAASGGIVLAQPRLGNPGQELTPDGRPTGRAAFVDPGPGGPAPRTADGHPDLTGRWKPIREPGKPGGNLGKDYPGFQLPFTPAGEKAHQFDLTQTKDPESQCILGGIPRFNASGMAFEILQTSGEAAFLYGYTTYRTIPIDGRPHEADPDPKYFGNGAGAWDGDVFVIDSVGFHDSAEGKIWADENGDPQSDQTHVVERWTRVDRNHLHLDEVVTDPKYYREPLHFSRTWVLGTKPGDGVKESACNENNLDAANVGPGPGYIGPDGARGYDPSAKLPDTPPDPDFYTSAAASSKAPAKPVK
jgi:hypothetical protein